jgi:hypothetical protein
MNEKPTTATQETEEGSGEVSCKKRVGFLADVGVMKQQATLGTKERSRQTSCLPVSVCRASLSNFHPGPYTGTQSRVIQKNTRVGDEDAGASVDKCSHTRNVIMKLKLSIPKTALAPEGVHDAKVGAVVPGGEGRCTLQFAFTKENEQFLVDRGYAARLDSGSPLLKDMETILGRKFTGGEAGQDLDLKLLLVDKICQIVVAHRRSSGGKLVASVTTVLPAVTKAIA